MTSVITRTGRVESRRRAPVAAGPEPVSTVAEPRRLHRPDIQGLRAVAVLLVVAFHAGLLFPGGFTGVDVFFVISGYVITSSLTGELSRTAGISMRRFYARRIRRLLPGLALMVIVVALAGTLLGPASTQHTGAITGVFASVFSANLYLGSLPSGYFDVSTTLNPLLHTWTLAVEEQFYLVFPLLLLGCWRLTRGRGLPGRRLIVVTAIAGLSIGSLAYSLAASPHHAFYGAPARAWEFGAGALLLFASPLTSRLPALPARLLALAGLGAILVAGVASGRLVGPAEVLPVAGACAILAAGTATRGGIVGLLSSRPACWIGDRSYGWYLWHWPLIVFAVALRPNSALAPPLAAGAALLPAWFSYRFVENPVRFDWRFRGRATLVVAVICTTVPILACLAMLTISSRLATFSSMSSWKTGRALHADTTRGCDTSAPLGERTGVDCTWRARRAEGRIVLFGDSNAGQFTEPVIAAGTRAGLDVTVATDSSCPYVGVPDVPPCERFTTRTLSKLVRMRPNLVILASRTDLYIGGKQSAANRWQRDLSRVLRQLNGAGIPVVVVHPVPRLAISPERCAVISILINACGSSTTRTDAERELRLAIAAERGAVAHASLAATLDLDPDLCGPTRCASMRNGVLLYRDDEHLSVQGALTLTDRFAQAIRSQARPSTRSRSNYVAGDAAVRSSTCVDASFAVSCRTLAGANMTRQEINCPANAIQSHRVWPNSTTAGPTSAKPSGCISSDPNQS
jgi:peptidoglycan/LPS O-acetylase OafA/YrhL